MFSKIFILQSRIDFGQVSIFHVESNCDMKHIDNNNILDFSRPLHGSHVL